MQHDIQTCDLKHTSYVRPNAIFHLEVTVWNGKCSRPSGFSYRPQQVLLNGDMEIKIALLFFIRLLRGQRKPMLMYLYLYTIRKSVGISLTVRW